jgi:hypothetical protein
MFGTEFVAKYGMQSMKIEYVVPNMELSNPVCRWGVLDRSYNRF